MEQGKEMLKIKPATTPTVRPRKALRRRSDNENYIYWPNQRPQSLTLSVSAAIPQSRRSRKNSGMMLIKIHSQTFLRRQSRARTPLRIRQRRSAISNPLPNRLMPSSLLSTRTQVNTLHSKHSSPGLSTVTASTVLRQSWPMPTFNRQRKAPRQRCRRKPPQQRPPCQTYKHRYHDGRECCHGD